MMLIMILLLKGQVAESAAGCFSRISAPPEEEQIVVPDVPEEEGNVRVIAPPTRTPAADVVSPGVRGMESEGGATGPE